MATLNIKNLPDDLYERLKRHGAASRRRPRRYNLERRVTPSGALRC